MSGILGGHLKDNETPEKALSRELKEEIGVTPVDFSRIAVLHAGDKEYEYIIYVVTAWTGSPQNGSRRTFSSSMDYNR